MKQKSIQDLSVLGHFAKTDVRYWQRTIFRQTYTRNGETRVTKDWAMKIAHVGRRETFPLGTPNKAAAAAKARDIYLLLVASGWEITLRRYKASLAVPKKVAANAERGQLVRLTKPRRKQARKKNDCQTGYRVEGAPRAPLLSRTAAFVRG